MAMIAPRFRTLLIPSNRNVILHARHQYAVGQGGFHAGELVAPTDASLVVSSQDDVSLFASNSFRYIYDCGSRQISRCGQLANRYAQSLPARHLDFLFLSHFDDDHVNGVPTLLRVQSGVSVDTIVMPWVDDVERLISFGRMRFRRVTASPFFDALIIDPVATLSVFNPRRILFVRRGPGDTDGDRLDLISPEGPDGGFRSKIRSDDAAGRPVPPRGSRRRIGSTEVVTIYDDAVIAVGGAMAAFSWLFKPYVRLADPARVLNFEHHAEASLGWAWSAFRRNVANPAVRQSLVQDPAKAKILASAYKAAFGNRNLTSLCLYSGPSATDGMGPRLMVKLGNQHCTYAPKIGWLGTGDALLSDPKDTQTFLAHYEAEKFSVVTLALPHHGALRNYSPLLVAALTPKACVVSAKPPRNWRHPHPDVMADVVSQGAQAVRVSDVDTSAFDEVFAIVP